MQTSQNNKYEVTNFRCRDCKYYKPNAELDGIKSMCKRIDHKKIRFAVPWFKSYDCDFGTPCSDFEPNPIYPRFIEEWEYLGGFDSWWSLWVEQWLPYQTVNKMVYFTINGDSNIEYGVSLLDYVFGHMFRQDGKLNSTIRRYYKHHKKSDEFPYGYELVYERIDGVDIDELSKKYSR